MIRQDMDRLDGHVVLTHIHYILFSHNKSLQLQHNDIVSIIIIIIIIIFLFQRISVLLFQFNSVLLHDGFVLDDRPEQ